MGHPVHISVLVFRKYGFVLVKKLFTQVEMDLLWACFDTQEFKQNMFTRSNGGMTRISFIQNKLNTEKV